MTIGGTSPTRGATRRPDLAGARILVVDDEESITDLVAMALGMHGAVVEVAHDGRHALDAIPHMRPHAVVLDVMLPDLDGLEVLRRMQWDPRTAAVPVLFLTAKGGVDDKVRGLAAGGDDYLAKPFSVEELVWRVAAVLRRAGGAVDDGPVFSFADLRLDEDTYEVWRGGQTIDLTPTEFRLLHFLLLNAGQVVSKAQIREAVWEYAFDGKLNMVEVYVSYLRKKLDAHGPPLIRTVRGVGYTLRVPPEPGPDAGGPAVGTGQQDAPAVQSGP
ncbi:MAG: response regulator transcription factor [Actinomycetota bacterium]|jgi:two-component system OmpR family response regulator|nr:response regulator transcription factor [Actinomycetota bacterium]